MRLLLTLQYLGTRYAGWQAQTNARAIQTVIEEALAKMYGTFVRIEGAGRTDSGVHALAQRAHFDAPFAIPGRGFVRGMNDLLPHDIRITAVEEVDDAFHCRFAAKKKTYAYRIWNAEVLDVFAWETYAHVAQPLDAALMHETAQTLVGTHDFKSFTVLEPEVSSTVRTIYECTVDSAQCTGEPHASRAGGGRTTIDERSVLTREYRGEPGERAGGGLCTVHCAPCTLTIRLSADGFLRFMVRRIAGSLIEIGRGKIGPESLRRALEPSFEEARWTAPAKGLVLEEIRY
jgi:tRNA pseudouridine38-40 synthase